MEVQAQALACVEKIERFGLVSALSGAQAKFMAHTVLAAHKFGPFPMRDLIGIFHLFRAPFGVDGSVYGICHIGLVRKPP